MYDHIMYSPQMNTFVAPYICHHLHTTHYIPGRLSCFICSVSLLSVTIFRHISITPKVFITFVVSIHPPTHPSTRLSIHVSDFSEIWHWRLLWKCVKTTQIWLKLGKHFGHFTWRTKYVLLLLATLNSHNSNLFNWNSKRLLGINIMPTCHSVMLHAECCCSTIVF
jgi:hypothetical protein